MFSVELQVIRGVLTNIPRVPDFTMGFDQEEQRVCLQLGPGWLAERKMEEYPGTFIHQGILFEARGNAGYFLQAPRGVLQLEEEPESVKKRGEQVRACSEACMKLELALNKPHLTRGDIARLMAEVFGYIDAFAEPATIAPLATNMGLLQRDLEEMLVRLSRNDAPNARIIARAWARRGDDVLEYVLKKRGY